MSLFNRHISPCPWESTTIPSNRVPRQLESNPDWDIVKIWRINGQSPYSADLATFVTQYAPTGYTPPTGSSFGIQFLTSFYDQHDNSRIKIPISTIESEQTPEARFDLYRKRTEQYIKTHKEEIDKAKAREDAYAELIEPTKKTITTQEGQEKHDTIDNNTRTDNLSDSSNDTTGATTTQHYYEGVNYSTTPVGQLQAYEAPTDKYSSRTDSHTGTNTGTQTNVGSGSDTLSFINRKTTVESFNDSYSTIATTDKDFESPLQIITRLLSDTLYRVNMV